MIFQAEELDDILGSMGWMIFQAAELDDISGSRVG